MTWSPLNFPFTRHGRGGFAEFGGSVLPPAGLTYRPEWSRSGHKVVTKRQLARRSGGPRDVPRVQGHRQLWQVFSYVAADRTSAAPRPSSEHTTLKHANGTVPSLPHSGRARCTALTHGPRAKCPHACMGRNLEMAALPLRRYAALHNSRLQRHRDTAAWARTADRVSVTLRGGGVASVRRVSRSLLATPEGAPERPVARQPAVHGCGTRRGGCLRRL